MKNLTLAALLFSVLAMSCYQDKQKDCPAYDPSFLFSWFPYDTVGSEYLFINDSGYREKIASNRVVCGTAYEVSERAACDVWGYIQLISKDRSTKEGDYVPVLNINHSNEGPRGIDVCNFNFGNFSVAFKVQNNDILDVLDSTSYQLEKHSNYTYHGKTYDKVVEVTYLLSSAKSNPLDKVYIAKGHGLIGYRAYPSGVASWLE